MRFNIESLRLTPRTLRKRLHSLRFGPLVTLHLVWTLLFTVLVASAVNTFVLRPFARHLFLKFGAVTSDNHAWDNAPQVGFVQNPGAVGEIRNNNIGSMQYINDIDLRSVHMTRPEAAIFLSHLRPTDAYLEYGTNGLTASVKRRVTNVTTIENRADWCRDPSESSDADVSICAPVTGAHSWKSLAPFINAPRRNLSHGENTKFDSVLLAGPSRSACALRILPQLTPTARVFYADFFRRPRSASRVLRYYTEIARIRARVPPYSYGMLVLVPKQNVALPHQVDVVRAANEEHAGSPGKREVDWDWVERSTTGGVNVYEISANVSRASAMVRICLDAVLLGMVALAGKTFYVGFWTLVWPGLNEAILRTSKTGLDRGTNSRQGYNTA